VNLGRTMRALAILLLLAAAVSTHAAEPTREEVIAADATVRKLCAVQTFSFGRDAFWGQPAETAGEQYLRRIMREKDPLPFLLAVYNHGTPAGKAYALAGIHYLAPELFEICRRDIWQSGYNPEMWYLCACRNMETTFQFFVMQIAVRQYDSYIEQHVCPTRTIASH
jgi:hypothetical protein